MFQRLTILLACFIFVAPQTSLAGPPLVGTGLTFPATATTNITPLTGSFAFRMGGEYQPASLSNQAGDTIQLVGVSFNIPGFELSNQTPLASTVAILKFSSLGVSIVPLDQAQNSKNLYVINFFYDSSGAERNLNQFCWANRQVSPNATAHLSKSFVTRDAEQTSRGLHEYQIYLYCNGLSTREAPNGERVVKLTLADGTHYPQLVELYHY